MDREGLLNVIRCDGCPFQDETFSLLLKLLPIALRRQVVFHRPGAEDTTFDEEWLLSLLDSIRRKDDNSVAFALCSRVEPHLRSTVRGLAERSLEGLDGADLELF